MITEFYHHSYFISATAKMLGYLRRSGLVQEEDQEGKEKEKGEPIKQLEEPCYHADRPFCSTESAKTLLPRGSLCLFSLLLFVANEFLHENKLLLLLAVTCFMMALPASWYHFQHSSSAMNTI